MLNAPCPLAQNTSINLEYAEQSNSRQASRFAGLGFSFTGIGQRERVPESPLLCVHQAPGGIGSIPLHRKTKRALQRVLHSH
jgi:hypothetical protein